MEDASRPDLSCELVHDYPNPVGIGLLVGLLGGEDVALQRVAPIVLGDAAVVHDIAALLHGEAAGGVGLRSAGGIGAVERSHVRLPGPDHPRKLVVLQAVAVRTDGVRAGRIGNYADVVVVGRVDVARRFDDGMEGGAASIEVGEAGWIGVADGLEGRQAGCRGSLVHALGIQLSMVYDSVKSKSKK